MVFKRRNKRPLLRQVQDAVYPPRGWRRAVEYIGHRIKRIPDTPHKIALGFAAGVFVSFTPFFGLHFILAAIVAMALRGNVLASLMGTFFGNPITFPIIATVSYRFGEKILNIGGVDGNFGGIKTAIVNGFVGTWQSILSIVGLSEPAWGQVAYFFTSVFLPYLIGGIVPGLIAGGLCYFLSRPLVAAYQKSRKARMQKKFERRQQELQSVADPVE